MHACDSTSHVWNAPEARGTPAHTAWRLLDPSPDPKGNVPDNKRSFSTPQPRPIKAHRFSGLRVPSRSSRASHRLAVVFLYSCDRVHRPSSINPTLEIVPRSTTTAMRTSLLLCSLFLGVLALPAAGLMPYARSLWDMMLPADDPFRVLEQAPVPVPRGVETLALARADWKENPKAHIISLDVPGVSKEDIKIEVEESGVLRISGERKAEEEAEGEKWHRAERTAGKFWRQFRLPAGADMDGIKAHVVDGVLRVTVPKVAEEKRQPSVRVVDIVEQSKGEDVEASKPAKM